MSKMVTPDAVIDGKPTRVSLAGQGAAGSQIECASLAQVAVAG